MTGTQGYLPSPVIVEIEVEYVRTERIRFEVGFDRTMMGAVQELVERRHNRHGGGALILTTNLPAETYRDGAQVVVGCNETLGESVWSRLTSMVDIVPVVGPDHRKAQTEPTSKGAAK